MAKNFLPIAPPAKKMTGELSQLSGALERIIETTATVLSDGKVQASEYFMLFGQFGDVSTIVSIYPAAAKQFKALSADQKEAEISALAAALDIPHEAARVRVFTVINSGGKIYGGLTKAYAGVLEIHKAFSASTPAEVDPANDVPEVAPKGKK